MMSKILSFIIALCLVLPLCANQRLIIITGGPGVGKTSLINHFQINGFHVINEAATDLIQERLSQQIEEPWNQDGFNMSVLQLLLKRQAEAKDAHVIFFDRSPIDVLTYSLLQNDKAHGQIASIVENLIAKKTYHPKVFLIENLGHCEQTAVRAESLEEALRIERHIEDQYRKYEFEVIRIPAAPIEERAQLILKHLELDQCSSS
jgi:predicted ATPase